MLNNGEWRASLPDLDEAIRLDPEDACAMDLRSIALKELGDVERATNDRQRALEIEPNVAELVDGGSEADEIEQRVDWPRR